MQALEFIQRMAPERLRRGARGLAETMFVNRRAPQRASSQLLDTQYEQGRWDYLADIEEMARYAVISGYCRYLGHASSVLDLGCGAGILRRWLGPQTGVYVGVDLSDLAIARARQEWRDAHTEFVARDAASYRPDRRFDVIVFNEMLYYFERPEDLLKHFAPFLEPDGRFLLSLWESPDSRRAWQHAKSSVDVIDSVEIRHHSGVSWMIRLCRPR